jgi:hypothetical protein
MKKNKAVTKYLATIGAKGGKSKSPKKQAASRANGLKNYPQKIHTLKTPCTFPGCKITNGHEHIRMTKRPRNLQPSMLLSSGVQRRVLMADNKNPNEKKPGEKPEGKYHYNPGNMSGKKAENLPKDQLEPEEHADKTKSRDES